MKKVLIFIFISVFLISCGSPKFDISENKTSDGTISIVYFSPAIENAKNTKADMPIVIIFSEDIDVDSAQKGLNVEKTGPGQKQNVKVKCTYNASEFLLQCLPETGRWDLKSDYSVKIKDVKSKDGQKVLDKEYSFTFSTI